MISGRLTHRARIERDTATGNDSWGNAPVPHFTVLHHALACFFWSRNARELVDGTKTAMIEDARVMFALDADVREGDVITTITDRSGALVVDGRLKIEGPVQFKHNHLEAALQRIS
ncbi:MAG: hypothetical protein ACK4IS_07315 [Erythrobacter sp.]